MYSDILLLAIDPCLLWWLIFSGLSFLLGTLLGWLLFGQRNKVIELEKENAGLKAQYNNLEKDYASLKYQLEEAQKDLSRIRLSLQKCESDKVVLNTKMEKLQAQISTDAGDATLGFASGGVAPAGGGLAFASIFKPDNLQIIEGIGPKIEEVLKNAGIREWSDVAASNEEALSGILLAANPNYRIHNPASWPQQASLAMESKWDELIQYQKFLDGGREDEGDFNTASKVEKMAMRILGFSDNPEDLKIIEGIGPKIETLLKDAGIKTWQQLAESAVERLQSILNAAGENYRLADPGTWPRQAEMAAAGQWSELKDYQDQLKGGK